MREESGGVGRRREGGKWMKEMRTGANCAKGRWGVPSKVFFFVCFFWGGA